MSYIAAGTAAAGLAGSLMGGGGGGGAAAAPNMFGATGITFGSVNFKSDGAGDRGKATTAGAAEAASQAAIGGAYQASGTTPGWLWPVVALAAVLALALVFMPSRKK